MNVCGSEVCGGIKRSNSRRVSKTTFGHQSEDVHNLTIMTVLFTVKSTKYEEQSSIICRVRELWKELGYDVNVLKPVEWNATKCPFYSLLKTDVNMFVIAMENMPQYWNIHPVTYFHMPQNTYEHNDVIQGNKNYRCESLRDVVIQIHSKAMSNANFIQNSIDNNGF